MPEADCPCGSGRSITVCCGPYVARSETAPTAEALMRSRYTAYTLGRTDYLLYTWHPATAPKELTLDAEERMGKSVESVKTNLSTIRTGRANSNMLDRVKVEYYGRLTPIFACQKTGTMACSFSPKINLALAAYC